MARHAQKSKTDGAPSPATVAAPVPSDTVGPPLVLLGAGFLSVALSVPLLLTDGIATHVVGYVFGALVPILLVGLVRRTDLDRRRSPRYQERGFIRPALAVLAVVALVAAGLHIWPIATELSK